MKFEPGYLIGMAMQSVPEPRVVARDVLALRFSRAVLWQTLALLVVISTMFGVLGSIVFPVDPKVYGPVLANPIILGVIEASVWVMSVFAIYWIGRAMGGSGHFDQAILTVIWVQFVMNLLKAIVFVGILIAPMLAMLVQLLSVAFMFWIFSHFIAEMHGFKSIGLVFVMILLSIMGLIFGLSIILAVIGVGVGVAAGI